MSWQEICAGDMESTRASLVTRPTEANPCDCMEIAGEGPEYQGPRGELTVRVSVRSCYIIAYRSNTLSELPLLLDIIINLGH